MKNAIFFLTYDGYYNFTSGIGSQTQIFLQGINFYKDKYFKEYGEFEINIIVPNFDKTSYGYNETNIKFCNEILNNFNGNIFVVESEIDKADTKFWTVGNWEKICKASAEMISKVSYKYKKCIIITVDPPFLQTAKYFDKYPSKFKFISLMYTSTFIHDQKVLQDRFLWEYEGFQMANINNNVKIGNICNYLTNHFIQKYSLKKFNFIDYSSSLFLESDDFKCFSEDEILDILKKYNIPLNKKIIFAFGRASWVKGFDTLLNSYPFIKSEIHIILLASQFEEIYSDYEKIINKFKIKCTLIRDFSRELPKALCQYEKCSIVVIPSIREPFSNIPFEVSLWAKSSGPIILTSDLESFKEQIIEGYNGFNFIRSDFKDLARKIDFILDLPQKSLNIIRKNAYQKVISARNFYINFKNILNFGFKE